MDQQVQAQLAQQQQMQAQFNNNQVKIEPKKNENSVQNDFAKSYQQHNQEIVGQSPVDAQNAQ